MADPGDTPRAAPGNSDPGFGGDNNCCPPNRKSLENGDFSMPSAAGDPMDDPRVAPYAPDGAAVKAMFRGGD
ncbi:MAG TPA: hypothetical protein VGO87_11405 [Acidimicrobiia bacterium]|jgi:hypothetical protein